MLPHLAFALQPRPPWPSKEATKTRLVSTYSFLPFYFLSRRFLFHSFIFCEDSFSLRILVSYFGYAPHLLFLIFLLVVYLYIFPLFSSFSFITLLFIEYSVSICTLVPILFLPSTNWEWKYLPSLSNHLAVVTLNSQSVEGLLEIRA